MKSTFAKQLRKRFDIELKRSVPHATLLKTPDTPTGWPVYDVSRTTHRKDFVVLAISPSRDEFTIECAWSERLRFPGHLLVMFPRAVPQAAIEPDPPCDGEYRFRLSHLVSPGDELWFRVADTIARTEPNNNFDDLLPEMGKALGERLSIENAAKRAVDLVISVAMPYFDDL